MEKQKLDRILQMIQSNETLKEQYKENPDATINIMIAWLDTEEHGVEIDPYYSRKQALEFTIQKLQHDLEIQREKGNIAEAEIIAKEIMIKSKMLLLIGKEAEHPEEVVELRQMQIELNETRETVNQQKEENLGPRL